MTDEQPEQVGHLLDTPNLAEVLDSERFKTFLDHIPIAIAVAELEPRERIVYANHAFERLTGQRKEGMEGQPWRAVPGRGDGVRYDVALGIAILEGHDHLGSFAIENGDERRCIDAWSNLIENDDGRAVFRLVALVEAKIRDMADDQFEARILEKDTLLRELQHRVKNNLQMITTLIRLESRNLGDVETGERFSRLAGRVEALALLYKSLSDEDNDEVVDLGVYLSQIASAVMRAHAVEGIHLNLQVDTWPVSINVAMPTGLVVNELMTNALKHAFAGREGGTITLKSLVAGGGCTVTVIDDGIGLGAGETWPQPGKLSALIVQSLRQNAKADIAIASTPGAGLRATIVFACKDAVAKVN